MLVVVPADNAGRRRPLWKDGALPSFYLLLFVFFLFLKVIAVISWPWAVIFFPIYVGSVFVSASIIISFRRMQDEPPHMRDIRVMTYYMFTLAMTLFQALLLNIGLEVDRPRYADQNGDPFPVYTLLPALLWGLLSVVIGIIWFRESLAGSKSRALSVLVTFTGATSSTQVSLLMYQLHSKHDLSWFLILAPSYVAAALVCLSCATAIGYQWKLSSMSANLVLDHSLQHRRVILDFVQKIPGVIRFQSPQVSVCGVLSGLTSAMFAVALAAYLSSPHIWLPYVFIPLLFSCVIIFFVACFRTFTREMEQEDDSDDDDDSFIADLENGRGNLFQFLSSQNGLTTEQSFGRGAASNMTPNSRSSGHSQGSRVNGGVPLGALLAHNPALLEQFLASLRRAIDNEQGASGGAAQMSLEHDYMRLLMTALAARSLFSESELPRGVPQEILDLLPTFVLDDKSHLVVGQHTCNICLCEFAPGDEVRTLPCFHFFHKTEIDEWLSRSKTCPLCKRSVDTADMDGVDQHDVNDIEHGASSSRSNEFHESASPSEVSLPGSPNRSQERNRLDRDADNEDAVATADDQDSLDE
jgi:hypothetical protein